MSSDNATFSADDLASVRESLALLSASLTLDLAMTFSDRVRERVPQLLPPAPAADPAQALAALWILARACPLPRHGAALAGAWLDTLAASIGTAFTPRHRRAWARLLTEVSAALQSKSGPA